MCKTVHIHVCLREYMYMYFLPAAKFLVHVRKPGVVAFQHEKHPDRWLRMESSKLDFGGGGIRCEMKVKDKGISENKVIT